MPTRILIDLDCWMTQCVVRPGWMWDLEGMIFICQAFRAPRKRVELWWWGGKANRVLIVVHGCGYESLVGFLEEVADTWDDGSSSVLACSGSPNAAPRCVYANRIIYRFWGSAWEYPGTPNSRASYSSSHLSANKCEFMWAFLFPTRDYMW